MRKTPDSLFKRRYHQREQTVALHNTDVYDSRLAGGSDSCSVDKQLVFSATMGERDACLFSPVVPAENWIKHWLSTHFAPKHSLEEGSQSDHWSSHSFCTRKRLVVTLLLILALAVMTLILLLNYYCIMVWHLCQQEEAVIPIFHTTPELEKQDLYV